MKTLKYLKAWVQFVTVTMKRFGIKATIKMIRRNYKVDCWDDGNSHHVVRTIPEYVKFIAENNYKHAWE